MKNKCQFCEMFNGEEIIDIEPLNPVVKGHRLVIPREHVWDITDSPAITGKTMIYASLLARRMGGDFNLITSKGKNATQTVFHLHLHLIPRKKGDGLSLPWTNQRKTKEDRGRG